MPEDAKIFGECYELYEKHRSVLIETDEQWTALVLDVRDFAERNDWRNNPLANRLALSLLDTFNDLYRNGKKPAIPDYFGRSDL